MGRRLGVEPARQLPRQRARAGRAARSSAPISASLVLPEKERARANPALAASAASERSGQSSPSRRARRNITRSRHCLSGLGPRQALDAERRSRRSASACALASSAGPASGLLGEHRARRAAGGGAPAARPRRDRRRFRRGLDRGAGDRSRPPRAISGAASRMRAAAARPTISPTARYGCAAQGRRAARAPPRGRWPSGTRRPAARLGDAVGIGEASSGPTASARRATCSRGSRRLALKAARWRAAASPCARRRASSARGERSRRKALEPPARSTAVAAEAAFGQHDRDLGRRASRSPCAARRRPPCAPAAAAAAAGQSPGPRR